MEPAWKSRWGGGESSLVAPCVPAQSEPVSANWSDAGGFHSPGMLFVCPFPFLHVQAAAENGQLAFVQGWEGRLGWGLPEWQEGMSLLGWSGGS